MILAQTLTATHQSGGLDVNALAAFLVALTGLIAAVERAWAAHCAGKAAATAQEKARDTKEMLAAVIDGTEDVLDTLPPEKREAAERLLRSAAEAAKKADGIAKVVEEVTHPERAVNGKPDFVKDEGPKEGKT